MVRVDDKFKRVLIDTFKAFDSFCKINGIKYYPAYGTLLGTVRHHGLIPWDDDIDVWMLPDDYRRFCSFKGQVNDHYEIFDSRDENYWLFSLAKFVDINTTIWEFEEYPCITGVYIDVFPLYECESGNAVLLKREYDRTTYYLKRSMKHYSLRSISSFFMERRFIKLYNSLKDIIYYIPRFNHFKQIYDKLFQMINNGKGDIYVSFESDYKEKEVFEKKWFEGNTEFPFEDMQILVPTEYNKILTQLYGNYMQLPPKNKRKSHHPHFFIDLDHHWTIDEIKNL